MHVQRLLRHLAGNINGSVESVATESTAEIGAFLRQFDHAFADHGEVFAVHDNPWLDNESGCCEYVQSQRKGEASQ
ncbi:hypothetical protein D3C81_2062470 [compost metagenome]